MGVAITVDCENVSEEDSGQRTLGRSYNSRMKRKLVAALALLIASAVAAQERKTPVSVAHTGKDEVGTLFAAAFNRQLSHSPLYEPMNENEKGFRFYVSLITIDTADTTAAQGTRSAVSVVIQDMGRPDSFSVPEMWYNKLIVVNRRQVDETAKKLLEDMYAGWCNTIRNSVVGCPKEQFEPKLSP
jgi:hypothetical protein